MNENERVRRSDILPKLTSVKKMRVYGVTRIIFITKTTLNPYIHFAYE